MKLVFYICLLCMTAFSYADTVNDIDNIVGEYSVDAGFVAGSIGVIFESDYSSEFHIHEITISRVKDDKRLKVKVDGAFNFFPSYDYINKEYAVNVFYFPLKPGEYVVSGITYTMTDNRRTVVRNKIPISIPIKLTKGKVSYIGQYLAHAGFFYSVKNELDRDKELINKKQIYENRKYDVKIPEFKETDRAYFRLVNEKYYQALKVARTKYVKEMEEEEAEGD